MNSNALHVVFGKGLEALGTATDQWLGSQADPNTEFAGAAMSPAFLAWAAIGLVPLALALRPLRRQVRREP